MARSIAVVVMWPKPEKGGKCVAVRFGEEGKKKNNKEAFADARWIEGMMTTSAS